MKGVGGEKKCWGLPFCRAKAFGDGPGGSVRRLTLTALPQSFSRHRITEEPIRRQSVKNSYDSSVTLPIYPQILVRRLLFFPAQRVIDQPLNGSRTPPHHRGCHLQALAFQQPRLSEAPTGDNCLAILPRFESDTYFQPKASDHGDGKKMEK
jgi:hypothetical protein